MKRRNFLPIFPVGILAAIVLWVFIAYFVVPQLIELIFTGGAPALSNYLLRGKNVHSLEDYLNYWTRISGNVLLVLSMAALIIAQMVYSNRRRRDHKDTSAAPMAVVHLGKTRRGIIHGMIAFIIAGSLVDIITAAEHWPFSPYPMYSVVKRNRTVTDLRLVGITKDPVPREFPLIVSEYLQPFDRSRLGASFPTMLRRPDREKLLRVALEDCLRRYEVHRLASRHNGPPLQGLRLYEMSWKLDPRAGNLDHPERKDLLFEVTGL
jgi:hypothetical protein